MPDSAAKSVLIHLGPHKTGSTAIQDSLGAASADLNDAGIFFLHNSVTHKAALDLANERFDEAEQRLSEMSRTISKVKQSHVLLSQEDFCGALAGRSATRRVYPKLMKNLRILERALRPHSVRFAFFLRDETDWLRSCYHQHLRYRTRFHSFDAFHQHFKDDLDWLTKLEKPRQVFGSSFQIFQYKKQPHAGLDDLLSMLGTDVAGKINLQVSDGSNRSPSPLQIKKLERINEMTEFGPTSWFSKSRILEGSGRDQHEPKAPSLPPWPPERPEDTICALPALQKRAQNRVHRQHIEDILPDIDIDLDRLADERLPQDATLPNGPRSNIETQSKILNYHLRGKSRLAHLNALTISYLRRDTQHTPKARALFHRIWREQGGVLVNELSTRWLISTLQTFLDHGENEAQRMIGTAGYFYANMIKIHEGERALEGHAADATYANTEPQTKNRFRGLDRYTVGGSDLMLNTNALALELALRDPIAGLVLQEFLLRVKSAETVFSRHDRTRRNAEIDVEGFSDVWCFFEPWDD